MNFLDEVYFDNSVRSYLIVLATIGAVLLIKKVVSRYIAGLLYLPVKRNWKTIEKEHFTALIIQPLSWFLSIAVAVFAIDKLTFPEILYFRIYGHSSEEILQKAGACLIIIYLFSFFLSLINFIALIFEQRAQLTHDKADDQLIIFFRDFLKVVVGLFGVLLVIKAGFNQNIGTLLTGLSIVGAALALAAKESLENLIASFVIFFDKPFYTGDFLKVNNVTGTVEHIGLRSTRIRTADKTLISVPNKQMVDSMVDNLSMRTERRAELKLDFNARANTTDLNKFVENIKTLFADHTNDITSSTVFISDYNKNGITVSIEYFTAHGSMDDFNAIRQNINLNVKRIGEELKLELASAVSDINIYNPEWANNPPKNKPII